LHATGPTPGPPPPDERVQVGAVDEHLPAVRMHDRADPHDARLEHAMRRRVRDHDRRQIARMQIGLALEVGEIDVAVVIASDDDDAHPGQVRGRRIRSVRGRRDQAHVAMRLAARPVVRLDHQQARVLALRAGVRLQRARIVAGRGAEHPLEIVDQLLIALRLLGRRERMQGAERGPGHRHHLGGRIELHRA
jgi:hypothetical protein